jgi:hypothetical protein
MKVAWTMSMDSEIPVIAFSASATTSKDAFVITNTNLSKAKLVEITLLGTNILKFRAFRTDGKEDNYKDIGDVAVSEGKMIYNAPPNSVTTFFSVH